MISALLLVMVGAALGYVFKDKLVLGIEYLKSFFFNK